MLVHEALLPGYGIAQYHTRSTTTDWTQIVRRDYTGELIVGRDLSTSATLR